MGLFDFIPGVGDDAAEKMVDSVNRNASTNFVHCESPLSSDA